MTQQSVHYVAQGTEGGGAALDQVIGMSVVGLVVGLALLWIGYQHRMRKITWLHDLGEWAGRKFHRPAWVALPIALFITTIITALFGFIWDVSLHIGKGRDPGPLANPAHYFILFGLFILFIAGCLACVLPYDKPGPAAVRITRHWYAPVGGVLMAGCGLYALIGFPLDDIWHRIFGQDVTLWGPTHLMMIGGAGFSLALTPLIKRPIVFGMVGGLGVATVGLWLESLWIGAVYDHAWPASLWPEALAMAIPVAVFVGACGAMIGMVLTNQRLPRRAVSIGLVALAVIAIGGATANGLRYEVPQNATATIALAEAPSIGDQRMATADIHINPPTLVSDDPNWVSILGWQGGLANQRGIFTDHLERVGPGHYRSTAPMPVSGQWKTLLRVHDGRILTAVPIYLHGDPGIGAAEVPAEASMTRPFVPEVTILQRERNPDTPQVLWLIGCLVVLGCTLVLIAGLSWGAGRLNKAEPTRTKAEFEPSAQA